MFTPKIRRASALAIATSLALSVTLSSAPAAAQTAPAMPPDIVRTKAGGMLRGTIVEKVPNDHVEILLPNGQSRTVPMTDVEYAGPNADDQEAEREAPAPAPPRQVRQATDDEEAPRATSGSRPSATLGVGAANLKLTSDQDGLTFHRKTGTTQGTGTGWYGGFGKNPGGHILVNVQLENFERLCTAPCRVDMAAGTYRLGLSLGDGDVIPAEQAISVRGPMRLRGHVESYLAVRVGGWAIAIAGAVAGMAVGLHSEEECRDQMPSYCLSTKPYPYLLHGLVIVGVSSLVGLLMALKKDEAHID